MGFKFPEWFFILQHRLVKPKASCSPLCYRKKRNTALYSGGTVADTAVSFARWQHGERTVVWGLSVYLGSVHWPKDGYQCCSVQLQSSCRARTMPVCDISSQSAVFCFSVKVDEWQGNLTFTSFFKK